MDYKGFVNLLENTFPDSINEKGATLYNSFSNLGLSDIYFLGLNPTGAGLTIRESLNRISDPEYNEYRDEIWNRYPGVGNIEHLQ